MKALKFASVVLLVLILTIPVAGQGPGGNGGGTEDPGEIPDTGELYGDLYVILRDENGVPMLNEYGCIQPISTVTDSTVIATADEPLLIEVIEGEPFGLPTYTDTAGDLVECELTEDMADWVEGVDFGRLNLGRSPDAVIAHAFDEAIKKMNIATAIDVDPAGRLVLSLPDAETPDPDDTVVKTIDAPAENLALYIKMMMDGHWITTDTDPIVMGGSPDDKGPPEGDGPSTEPRPVLTAEAVALLPIEYQELGDATRSNTDLTSDELQLAASLLAAAADKTGHITLDKVVYINSVYGINQVGSLTGETEGKTYFDYGGFGYSRNLYEGRSSGACGDGWIWVLQPDLDGSGTEIPNHFEAQCMEILGYDPEVPDPVNAVHFTNMVEAYTTVQDANGDPLAYDFDSNVRAFAQSADDALRVIEYIHNYKVPEVLYP